MLLRRLTEHVKDQNWFAVFLDFFIVVVGILIAFQITNWNDARTDAIREKEILAELIDDLQADQAALSNSSALNDLGINAGNMLLIGAGFEPIQSLSTPIRSNALATNVLEAPLPPQPTDDIRGELWKHLAARLYPKHNDATIESLIAAGNSSIIKDTSLLRDLQRYRTIWAGVEDAQINTFRPLRDKMIFAGQEHGLSPLTPVDLDVVAEAVRTDAALKGALKTMVEYTIVQQGFYEQLLQVSEALEARIEGEL